MDHIINDCWDYIKKQDTQKVLKENFIFPMKEAIYKEFFLYIWIMYLYHIIVLIILLAILIMTLKKYNNNI
jgi:hypothetical protein